VIACSQCPISCSALTKGSPGAVRYSSHQRRDSPNVRMPDARLRPPSESQSRQDFVHIPLRFTLASGLAAMSLRIAEAGPNSSAICTAPIARVTPAISLDVDSRMIK